MKIRSALLLIAVLAVGTAAQTVSITPKKVSYKRAKPEHSGKRTFTITYPKVRAASPALSQKIERAISYESVLDLRLRDELGQYQWLEEANYETKYNKNGILCINLWMEGSAAYPDSSSKIVVVDTRTGVRARPADVFTDLTGLAASVPKKQEKEKRDAIERIRKEEPDADQPELLFGDKRLTIKDLDGYEVGDKGVTFHYNYEFPHVAKALEPDGSFFYTWSELRPYIKKGGLLTRIAR